MDELVELVSKKAGIPEATARTAVNTVVDFLKKRLPAPLAGQVDAVLSGVDADQIGNIAQGLGGMLGGKK